jgi:hypothetical protein
MNAISIPANIELSFPFELSRLIGSLPVLESEEEELYWYLFKSVAKVLHCDDKDPREFMLIKTIVDCDWLNLRYERAKTRSIDLRFQEALANILERIIEDDTIDISRKRMRRDLLEIGLAMRKRKKRSNNIFGTMALMKILSSWKL